MLPGASRRHGLAHDRRHRRARCARAPARLADRCRIAARACLILAERPRPGGRAADRPPPRRSTRSPARSASPADWWDLGGKRTHRLAGHQDRASGCARPRRPRARRSARQPEERARRDARRGACPRRCSCARTSRAPAPLRDAAGVCGRAHRARRRRVVEWRTEPATASARAGRRTRRRRAQHPPARPAARPASAHRRRRRMRADGRSAQCLRRRVRIGQTLRRDRPALRPQARAAIRESATSQRSRRRRRSGRRRGRGLSRREPDAHAVPARPRAGEPLLSLRPPVSRSDPDRRFDAELAARRRASNRAAALRPRPRRRRRRAVDYPEAWRVKRAALEALTAPSRARARRSRRDSSSRTTAISSRRAARRLRRSRPSRRSPPARRGKLAFSGRSRCATAIPRRVAQASTESAERFDFALFCQWLADRQLGRAAERARDAAGSRSASIAISRSGPRRTAPKPGRTARGSTRGATVGAPPDPFSVQGQNWSLPAPNPLAGAREGWAGAQRSLRRQHAARRHAAHRPRDGSAASLPDSGRRAPGRGRLSLLSARRSRRPHRAGEPARAMHGRRRGSRHGRRGFRDRMTKANIPGMRVLWFERKASEFAPPAAYPPLSVACVATHDLPTLAGWWQGTDIAERLSLGLLSLSRGGRGDRGAARGEARPVAALLAAGLIGAAPADDEPLDDADGGGRPRLRRRRRLAARQRPGRRPRRRRDRDQPARHRSRTPELANQHASRDVASAFSGPRATAILSCAGSGPPLATGACVRR